ncbi:hypothetical protein [Cryobacterium tepidiphilum]|uniref:Uncharacterized protein n=1 Tax=Cryobacterium tepidiphilum TaxID=2486026 RepID=A0A3M8L3V5_9MICO|nr:hypothetical protein [Cryobacterium tepidiphilum]RNE59334.1 hypothetical protein EEJ31_09820 [Cryobacterium tepidiphilum]
MFATISWLLRDIEPWWSSALINAGVVVLLLVPGDLALRGVRQGIHDVDETAQLAKAAADSAVLTANRTEQSLDDVREQLIAQQRDEHDAEVDVYRSMVTDPSRASLLRALQKATDDQLVTANGVRSPVWETDLHYRYVIGAWNGEKTLEVRLEADDGEVLSTHIWEVPESAAEFYQRLVGAVRAEGQDLGLGLNDPTHSVAQLSEMLVEVMGLRAQVLAGHRQALRLIIERVDGWYFTETHVLPASNLKYTIDVQRLSQPHWEEHLRRKGWYEAAIQIPFARRLYGVEPAPKGP